MSLGIIHFITRAKVHRRGNHFDVEFGHHTTHRFLFLFFLTFSNGIFYRYLHKIDQTYSLVKIASIKF